MKKAVLLVLTMMVTVSSLVGCGSGIVNQDTSTQKGNQAIIDKVNKLIEEGRVALFGLDGAEVDYELAMNCFMEAAEEDIEEAAEANYYIGHMYDDGYGVLKDYEKAYEYLSKAAEYNNAKALFSIGYLYYNGQYVEENKDTAKEYFDRALEAGLIEAYEGLAAIAYNEGNYARAEELVLEVVEKGSEPDLIALAMLDLADLYTEDKAGMVDYAKALEWCEKAVALNYPSAYNYMGLMYHYGYGVEKDRAEALKWYEKGAEYGNAASYNNIGNSYIYEYGVSYDPYKAAENFEEAAKRQYVSAMYKLGTMYGGETVETKGKILVSTFMNFEQNFETAVYWYQKAAEAGNAKAMLQLGAMYEEGAGVEKDYSMARTWYEAAADEGNVLAMAKVGMCYYKGIGIDVNYENGFQYLKKSADAGSCFAAYNVAVLYGNGQGVERDLDEALVWAQKALDMGHENAQDLITAIKKAKK